MKKAIRIFAVAALVVFFGALLHFAGNGLWGYLAGSSHTDAKDAPILGAYLSDDRTLKVHFLHEGKVFYTRNESFEVLAWRAEDGRVLVLRDQNGQREFVGFARRRDRGQGGIEWHPSESADSFVVLQIAKREGD